MRESNIERISGCIITHGNINMGVLMGLINEAGEGAVMDTACAGRIGASMVMGTKDNIEKLLANEAYQEMVATQLNRDTAGVNLSPEAIEWLKTGDRGASSETIFYIMTGCPVIEEDDLSYPHDSSDFARCRKLLDAVPAFKARLGEMKSQCPQWAALVDNWDQLSAAMDSDLKNEDRKLYGMIRALYEPIEQAQRRNAFLGEDE